MVLTQAKTTPSTTATLMNMTKMTKSQSNGRQPPIQSKEKTKAKQVDPWSFLDLIEAPQWVDFSEEATFLTDPESSDPWFDNIHRHHVISLADKNSDMKWLRLSKPKNKADEVEVNFVTRNGMKKHQQAASKSTGKSNADQLKKFCGHNQSKTRLLQKEVACPNYNNSRSSGMKSSSNRCSGSQSSFSGSSGISMNSSLYKYRRSCSERLSVTSRLKDSESPRDSVLTVDSTSSYVEEKLPNNLNERISNAKPRRNTYARKFGDDLKNTDQVSNRHLNGSVMVKTKKTGTLSVHQMAKAAAQCEVNDNENKAEGHYSPAEPFRRQCPLAGKENLKPGIDRKSVGRIVGPSDLAIMRKSKIKSSPIRPSSRGSPQSHVEKLSGKSGILGDLNVTCAVKQKKRVETWQSAVAGSMSAKISKPEMDLADLVAQHNQKIKTLRLHGVRKGLR